jgi:murein DD-endopeptidase MepM/ murein hydrolase activator NlpD
VATVPASGRGATLPGTADALRARTSGFDLAAEVGAPVLAVEAGRIRHAGPVAGRGTVTVQHHDGLLSTYEPLRPRVRAGDVVEAGDILGTVLPPPGPAHCTESTCLHLGARRLGSYLDPLLLLRGGRLVLLPISRGH